MKKRIGISLIFFVLINIVSYIFKTGFLAKEGLDSISFKISLAIIFCNMGYLSKNGKKI